MRRDEPAPEETQRKETPAAEAATVPKKERIAAREQRERFTDDEWSVLYALGEKTRSADELVELTQLPARRVLSTLTMLQIAQAVEERPGRRFLSRIKLEEE